ncbi:hypothetical protein Goklo_029230 [Gossypium klotzschianum]|uniref:Uncharacterized protein n=1 Tax=Gossypium klotzschianum TaxID=34286 RepID=A0A7J8W712_9ROSI|nr:hypothetical protein [Gossypium klotzschianum]
MVDLHNTGTFNTDTGFKVGYLNELERIVIKKSVNSDIVVSLIMTKLLPSTQKIEPLEKMLKQPLILLKK